MDSLVNLLRGVAPALATAVAGPLGGAAVSLIASKLGVEDSVESVAKAIVGDPNAALKLKELDLEFARLDAQDRNSAREREAKMGTANGPYLAKVIVPCLAIFVILTTFGLIGLMIFTELPYRQEQIIIFALGFITSAATQVLSYYFGSSQGSNDKNQFINWGKR